MFTTSQKTNAINTNRKSMESLFSTEKKSLDKSTNEFNVIKKIKQIKIEPEDLQKVSPLEQVQI